MAVKWTRDDPNRATVSEVDELINLYLEHGGTVDTIREGILGHGLVVMQSYGLKAAVVQEYPLNCWSSAHKVRFWNKLPMKYVDMLEEVLANE